MGADGIPAVGAGAGNHPPGVISIAPRWVLGENGRRVVQGDTTGRRGKGVMDP